jgi:uncharacterized CHY-type Zn-finger protein
MTCTKQLNVARSKRCPAFRKGYYVVKMKFICCAANYAFTAVTFPNFKFYRSWNYAASFRIIGGRFRKIFITFYSYKLEFKYVACTIIFNPRVNKMEYPVV